MQWQCPRVACEHVHTHTHTRAHTQHTHTHTHTRTELEQQLVGKWESKKLQGRVWVSAISVTLPNVNKTGDTIRLVVKVWSHVT